jgi:hypothetical protein
MKCTGENATTPPKELAMDDDGENKPYETTEEIFAALAREGKIIDSSSRRWSERKKRW